MSNMRFFFPAAAGTQGSRPFYTACVPFGMLSRLMAIDTGNVMDRSQRQVDTKRANAISKYICENEESFVLPALTGVIEDETLEFIPASKGASVGELNLSMDATIKLFDGQHRATGILEAISQRRTLKSQQVTIQLFVNMSLADRQQAFSDINSNAKAVSASLNMTYNKRDNAVNAIKEEIAKVSCWEGQIDYEKNVVGKNTDKLFTYRHVVQASRLLLGIGPKQTPDPMLVTDISKWWNSIAEAVAWQWQVRVVKDVGPENSVAFTAAGLMTLARVYRQLTDKYGCKYSVGKYAIALGNIDWRKSNEMWLGNLVDEKGNMRSGTAGQIEAAEQIVEAVSAFCEMM
ncbi:DNA sulfur modification protein DndB [Alkalimonas mucilaginosa]|uniref:DNA sulfur modification protein DndB n=1 Tax=Alkalimonas mucilaginosa TaxID=3057676 RepID=A0ABU7JD39_9GAMM|nr:DNA sulfur modification protein DndB [Alkalimonas sp. MEB004]MEE2023565.1 DNA sulfur modification protein DndB [Alkalimonas sp. MEB004]